jgi:hypothetical protein
LNNEVFTATQNVCFWHKADIGEKKPTAGPGVLGWRRKRMGAGGRLIQKAQGRLL